MISNILHNKENHPMLGRPCSHNEIKLCNEIDNNTREYIYTQNSGKIVMKHVSPGLVEWLKRLSQIGGGSL